MQSNCFLPLAILVVLLARCLEPAWCEERSVDEFKQYVSEKLGDRLSAAQLIEVVEQVDRDADGIISDREFDTRFEAIRKTVLTTSRPAPQASTPLIDSPGAAVLLITSRELAPAWQPFVYWKTSIGKPTKTIVVDQIAEDYQAETVQESIRLCVRDHIDNHHTRWVILGGDCLPDGGGVVPGGHTTAHAIESDGIPTDIVYLSKTNWDADGDGVYGEWPDDRDAITYPDGSVGLGRIPVRTAEDVAAVTEKIIAYESNYPTDRFAKEMVYTCTVPPAYPKVRRSWDDYVSKNWDGRAERFFAHETPWDGEGEVGSYALSAANLSELINSKSVGKLHIHGHGFLPAWVLEDSAFVEKHVEQLSNEGAYPLITTVSCFTGQYDAPEDPSIVEKMIRQPKAGSVAIVAPVRTGKPHFAKPADLYLMVTEGKLDGTTLTMTRYWCHGMKEGATTGEAIMMAKADMADDAKDSPNYHLCVCELNLLGDPTLCMRSDVPRLPEVNIPDAISLGEQTLSIETDAPSCTVCLWQGPELYHVSTADSRGTATFNIAPKRKGDLLVSVSGKNLNAARKVIRCVDRATGE